MNKEVSLYLDLTRFLAALLVMVSHFSFHRFTDGNLDFFHAYGHVAVVVFFVLSGYVISFVADKKENNSKDYFISRFARLYSVVLAVLILVLIIDTIGQSINPTIYQNYFRDSNYFIRLIANISFLQQVWFYNIGYLSDGPLWSLGYEFWYYVLFGLSLFIKGKKKYLFVFLVALLLGPKILLLLPVWLFGVWIYNFHKNKTLNKNLARSFFLSAPILFLVSFTQYNEIDNYIYSILSDTVKSNIGFSLGFLTDYITAFFVGVHLLSMKYVNFSILHKTLWGGEKMIRFFANSSFSIYLFHFPLLLFFGAILNHNPSSIMDIMILFIATFITCLLLAQITEKKKYIYKKYIVLIWNSIENRIKQ